MFGPWYPTVIAALDENDMIFCVDCLEVDEQETVLNGTEDQQDNAGLRPLTNYELEQDSEGGVYCDACGKELIPPDEEAV